MQLKDLIVSDWNVREQRDDDDIANLKASIKKNELISKLVLRPTEGGKFEIVAGQRRYKALLELHGEDHELSESEYVLREGLKDEEAFLLSVEENTQRLALSPLELNKAALKLNQMGFEDKDIATTLNITPYRLKRIVHLSEDSNRIPDAAKQELRKPPEECKFSDAHWLKLRDVEDPEVIQDVVDYIVKKESPPRDVPTIVKAVQKQFEGSGGGGGGEGASAPPPEDDAPAGPIEYAHKGQLVLEKHGDEETLKVIGKGEDEEVPLEHYLEYLRHPEKFKCQVTFKMKVKAMD